jgi:Uncharacterized conserved protein
MLEPFYAQCGPLQHKKEFKSESLSQLKSVLPEELMSLLSQGEGSYMGGYLWVVDPYDYKVTLEEVYTPVEQPSTCIARDAFAGLYVWEGESIVYINVRHGHSKVMGRKVAVFFNKIITDWSYMAEQLHLENFQPAKEALGDLNADECYGYVPLLGLGGPEKTENLQKVKIKEHISLIAQALGKII